MTRTLTDAELVTRVRAGDTRAFELMHARYRRPLERYADRLLGGRAGAAEDVVQESFLRAFRALVRDERQIALRPWLYRIVYNRAMDELRRRTPTDGDQLHEAARLVPPGEDPYALTAMREGVHALITDIGALPDRQRQALLRHALTGDSHVDLATELGLTVAASKALVGRARASLARAQRARASALAA